MARNYPKEARLSKMNAESFIRRAMWVTLLYSLAGGLLLSLVYLFAMEFVPFDWLEEVKIIQHGFMKIEGNDATHKLVLMQAIDALMSMLNGGDADIVAILIVLAVPVLIVLITLIKAVVIMIKTGDVEHSIANPHLKAHKENFRKKRAVCKQCIKTARKNKDKGKLNAAKRRLRELEHRAREIKRYYRFNRYAKNEQTQTVYRYWTRRAEKNGRIFFFGFRVIVTAFFGLLLWKSSGLIEYVDNLAQFDEINTQQPLPTVFEALTPVLTFGENAADTLYLQLAYIALAVGVVFQFLVAPLNGSISKVRLADHEITYMHMRGAGYPDQMDYQHSYYNFEPNYAGEIFPYFESAFESRPRRWDESDAILEERPREVNVALFFMRNLCQVCFCFAIVALFVYLFPALQQIEKIEQRPLMGSISFGLVFQILKWLMILLLVLLLWYALSSKEYVFDSMHEETEKRRKKYVTKLVLLALLFVIYLVLLYVPEFVASSDGTKLYSIKKLFETAVPSNDPTAVGAFVPVFKGIVSTFVTLLLVIVGAIIVDVALRPRDKKRRRDSGDFFAIHQSWENIPLDDD